MEEENIQQRFICVWLDNQLMRSEDYIDTQNHLRTLVKVFRSFTNSDECVDFITDIIDARIFLIISYPLGKLLVPLIHSFEQINSIYIFHSNKTSDEEWIHDYKKIKRIYHNMNLICDQFMNDTTEPENEQMAISFVSSADINSRDINRQDPSFMYFQLLKEIILNDCLSESEEETKNEMITFCRSVCIDNPNAIVILDEFEESFIPELSIYWYTRECFLYKMLNKALWTPEPDVLYKLRYFLRHLHRQILAQAKSQREQLSSMTVYRGQCMSVDQIEKLKQNIGGFLSFNNFLSTSLKRDVACNFLIGSETGVLFEMEIDPSIQKFPVVNIELISYLQKPDCEQELLFAMGSVFRILAVNRHINFYRVQLALSDDIDEQLVEYTKRTREKTQTTHSFLSLLRLMDELSQYNSIDKFAEMLRNDIGLAINPNLFALMHHSFGSIYHDRGQYEEALDHYHKSLNIYLSYLPSDHPTLTPAYNNIACVHISQEDYDKALEFQQLALDAETKSDDPDLSSIITYTNNLARIYTYQKKYNEALTYHQRALELQKQFLGENHPSVAETYNLISSIYYKMDDYGQGIAYHEQALALEETTCQLDPEASANSSIRHGNLCLSQGQYPEALYHFHHALEIQQQYYLSNNPALATTYDHIANVYYQQDQFEESLPYYKKALEIEQSSLSDDHPSIATSYFNISKAYLGLSHLIDALEYGLKAVEHMREKSRVDLCSLATVINHVGYIYYRKDEYQHALSYYNEAIGFYHAKSMENDPSLAAVYYRAGDAYCQLGRYREALDQYQKTLHIELKTLPDNAKTIADTYYGLSRAYLGLRQRDEALITGEQAIEQLLKTLPDYHLTVLQYRIYLETIKKQQIF